MDRAVRPSGRRTRRRLLLAALAVVLLGWIGANAATGRGPWAAAGRYAADLFHRAGPTRDLGRRLQRAAGRRPARPIQLRVWDWWSPSTTEDYARYFGEVESIFEARHPDVDVVFQAVPFTNYEQKLATGMLGDNPPDVFQCSVYWAEGLYQRGMLRRLNDFVARTPELQDEQFMLPALYHSRQAGHIFGIPHIVDAASLLWNLDMIRAEPALHDMFERRPDGTPDFRRIRFDAVRDWNHFRQIAQRLTKRDRAEPLQAAAGLGGKPHAGFALDAYGMGARSFMPWAAANGVRFQDRAGRRAQFDTPAAADTLQFLADLYWKHRVCSPFRRELTSHGQFESGEVACAMAGTWSGKYLVRDTQGWMGFGMTAFPPGPNGRGYKTLTWANMMAMSSRCRVPEVAWEYIRLICGLEGSLLRLKHLNQNSPRLDFYEGDAWAREVRQRPYLANVRRICAVGDPLLHTQVQAVEDEVQPILEYVLLNWPEIEAGRGSFRNTQEAIHLAAERVNEVFRRYDRTIRSWDRRRGRLARPEGK